MRTRDFSLDMNNAHVWGAHITEEGSDNMERLKHMKKLVSKAVRVSLTERQRVCLTMYYIDEMKLSDIADKLELDKSTVSRHITSARRKLKQLEPLI